VDSKPKTKTIPF